jgi:hypothetical protein
MTSLRKKPMLPVGKAATQSNRVKKSSPRTQDKDAIDSITALSSMEGTASKRFFRDESGEVRRENFNAGMFFKGKVFPVSNILDLSTALRVIEEFPTALVIRGAPLTHVDLDKPNRRIMENFKTPKIGRHWVLIDFDKIEMPDALDLSRDTPAVMEHLVHLLPAEFHDCSYHYQLSSSAGMGDPSKVSAHIWFWLSEPWTDERLKEWGNALNTDAGFTLVDTRLFQDVQAHYTAAPQFDNVANPFPIRSALVLKANDEVTIKPITSHLLPPVARSTGYLNAGPGFEGWLGRIGDHPGGMGFRQPILRATASYVALHGRAGTDVEALCQTIQKRVLEADRSAHSDEEIAERASRENIIPAIKGALAKYGDQTSSRRRSRIRTNDLPIKPSASLSRDEADNQLSASIKTILSIGKS